GTVANVEVVAGGALTLQAGLFGGAQTRFEKEGAGALALAAAGTFAGEVRINAGKLELRTTAALSSAARATVADGGVLVFNAAAAGAAGDHSFQGSGNVLSLGTSGSGAVNLGFGISGTTNDRLVLGTGQSFTVNATSVLTDIYVAGTPLLNSYTLVQSASGADFGDFTLGTIFNPGAFIYTLDTTQGNALVLNLTAAAVSEPLQAYWKGDLGGNGAGVWAAAEVGGNTNWATAADGLVDTQTTPGALTDVFFNAAGAANFTTSLGADLSVKSVTFLSGSGSGGSATVVTGGNTLTLGTGGFSLLAGSGSISFSPAIRLGASQTWSVADAAAIFTVSGPVSGSGDLTKTGAGTVVFSGVHARTGKTVIEAGAIQISDETGLGDNPAGGFVADQLTLNGGTLITTATMLLDDANRGITLGANGGTFSVNSGTTLTVASALAGSGGLTKSGAGTLVFNTGNTFARATVTTGTMNLAGLTNTITGSLQVGTLATGTLNYAVAGGSLSVGSGSASTLEVGIINDATTAARVGTLDLRGSANFTANVGLLRVGAFVSGANVGMEGDMYLATNNTITATTSFIVANSSSAGVSGTNTVAFGSGISTVNTPVFTIGGLKGSGEATIATGGTLTVQGIGAGTTGLSVGRNAGNTGTITTSLFNMTGGTFIGNLGAVIVGEKSGGGAGNATATMTLGSSVDNNVTATSLTVGSYASGTSTTSASFATGTLNMGGGAFRVTGNVVVAGHNDGVGTSTGSLNLTGGTFTVEGSISKGASASSTATITLNGGTLDMTNGAIGTGGANEQINFMAQQGTLRNVAQLNGGSALTKTTAGTLIVSGTNTYTGATTVQAGVLQVGEAHAGSITSATTVQAGATLAGTGTVSNQVNVLNDSFLKPGDAGGAGKGRLTVGTLSVEQGGQMQLQLSAATVPQSGSIVSAITGPGWVDAQTYFTSNAPAWEVAASPLTSHDAITVNGTLTLGTREAGTYGSGTILLVNDEYLSALGDVFNLLDWVGMIQGGFNVSSGVFAGSTSVGDLDLPALQAGHSWDTSAFMTQGILVVVPEPSRVLLLLLAATSITLRRRRSK
ncbi:MAG: autotransporter-associated beta strand repeat-containing protein, partial [Verrucomicrobium sp.]|nr:autotransporter-associated beta strand repeat-containing protein [Verrucomicrobium sp.]